MVARQALRDIVQQDGAVQHVARLDALDHVAGDGVVFLVLAALDGGDIAHGADQMLVHCIMVVHVELHQPHGMAEFGNETAQHARFVHQAQRPLGIVARGEGFQEGLVGHRIGPHRIGDQVE